MAGIAKYQEGGATGATNTSTATAPTSIWKTITDFATKDGGINWGNVLPTLAGVAGIAGLSKSGFANSSSQPVGYQGGIPNYVASREAVPATSYDPTRRPGSTGQRYFTDVQYNVDAGTPIMGKTAEQLAAENAARLADQQAQQDFIRDLLGNAGSAGSGSGSGAGRPVTGLPRTNPTLPRPQSPAPIQSSDINSWLQRNPGATDAQIRAAMDQYKVTPAQMAAATNLPLAEVTARYNAAGRNIVQDYATEALNTDTDDYGIPRGYAPLYPAGDEAVINPGEGGRLLSLAEQYGYSPADMGSMLGYSEQEVVDYLQTYFPDFSSDYLGKYGYAKGGLATLPESRGYYLGGSTDGMADKVPARIDGKQEARLSDGEFIMPADVVSHLGNGNSEAGAKVLYSMMDRVRKARTGDTQQGRQINPNKVLPV